MVAFMAFSLTLSTIPYSNSAARSTKSGFVNAGRTPNTMPNTILNGAEAPKDGTGLNGDFYIDSKSFNFYGPKKNGNWPPSVSLRGAQGQRGVAGSAGSEGSSGRNGSNGFGTPGVQGPQGSPGSAGLVGPPGQRGDAGLQGLSGAVGLRGETGSAGSIGPAGVKGIAGPNGLAGATGTPGLLGAQGAQGAQGAPGVPGNPGSQGMQGSAGIQGSAGSSGSIGLTGATGPSGPTGASGVNRIKYGAVSFASVIQGAAGTSQASNPFGSFQPGKNYFVHIQFDTFNATKNLLTYPLMLEMSVIGASPQMRTTYVVANGSYWVGASKQDEVIVSADLLVDGSAVTTSYQLVGTLTCGAVTTVFAVTLSGNYTSTEISELTQF